MVWSPFAALVLAEEATTDPGCEPGFVAFYNNDGTFESCVSENWGQPCLQLSDDGSRHSGTFNDVGECIPNDKSHLRTQEDADAYCKIYYGGDAAGFFKADGTFGGCCSGGMSYDPNEGGCVCPAGQGWDEETFLCVPDADGGTPQPPSGSDIDCGALYGPNHYPAWSDDAGQWGCFSCRPDERGQEDALCYCKPGSVRADPNDPSSACIVRSGSGGGVVPGGGSSLGGGGSSGKASEEKKSIWPWVLGGVALAAVGTAVYLNRPRDGALEGTDDEGMPRLAEA